MSDVGSTSTTEVSAAKEQKPNDKNDAANKFVLISIRHEESGEIECTFKIRRSHMLERVYEAFKERRGRDSFIHKLQRVSEALKENTPGAIHNATSQSPITPLRTAWRDSFILKFGEKLVAYGDTPNSLGMMKDRVELTCVRADDTEVKNIILTKIRDEESGAEYTFKMVRSHKLNWLYKAFRVKRGRGGEDSFILKLNGRMVAGTDTPGSLGIGMRDHAEFTSVPAVKVVIRNFWTQKEEWPWNLQRTHPFRLLHMSCIKMRGNDGFDLSYNGRRLKLNETPTSLGVNNLVEILCVPVPMVTIVLKDKDNELDCEHEVVMRRDQKLTKLGLFHKEARIFMYGSQKLSLQETPDSLNWSDRVEIFCVPSSSVIIDIFNVETQKVEWTTTLESSSYFRHIFMECEKRRPHYEYGAGSIFYLEYDTGRQCCHPSCNTCRIRVDQQDTPHALGMAAGERVVLSYTPNPVVEIDLYKDDGELDCTFMRTFRLKPNQPLFTIFNAYSKMSFYLLFKGNRVLREATPESLGMSASKHVKLILAPVVVIDVYNRMNQDVDAFDLGRKTVFRTLYEHYKKSGSYESSLDFYFRGLIIDLDKDTPNSLNMKDREEVECVPQYYEKPPEREECPSGTIDIVFKSSSDIGHVVLRHGSDEKMKSLLSRYAERKRIPLKSLRFKHDGKMLFVSSIGKKSPYDLGMQHNDIVYVSRLESVYIKHNDTETTKQARPSQASAGARKGKAKSKKKSNKKKSSNQPSYSTMNEKEILRREHSKMLTLVFDEANLQFKEIRQKLNSLALEQTPPKLKRISPRVRVSEPKEVESDISPASLDNKAIKTHFNVLVGEVSNLYKSTKPSKKTRTHNNKVSFTIDLHGFTKEAAVIKLDASLPSWIDAAMHGDYPFVIPVTIICGAGGQVLSEVVEKWIRENEGVANARKNI